MKLSYKSDYISVEQFNTAVVEDFTILIGLNGSGKTHLLNAVKKGHVIIEGIDKSEVVYYNYNDFTVVAGNPQQNSVFQTKINEWKVGQDKQEKVLNSFITQALSHNYPAESILFNIMKKDNFDYEKVLGNKKDYEALENLKNSQEFQNITSRGGSAINLNPQGKSQRIWSLINKNRGLFSPLEPIHKL